MEDPQNFKKMARGNNKDFYELLISEVKARTCLYDPCDADYKDRYRNEAAWVMVGQALGISAEAARKTWHNLRSSFSRYIRNSNQPQPEGSQTPKECSFYLESQMEFLKKYMRNGPVLLKGNKEFYERVIQEVQGRPCLYDPSHQDYKDRQRTDVEWGHVGNSLGISAEFAKRTWHNLRCSYNRCIRNGTSNPGPSSSKESNWYLKDQMDFLKQHVRVGSFNSSLSMPYDSIDDQSFDGVAVEFDLSDRSVRHSGMSTPSSSGSNSAMRKRNRSTLESDEEGRDLLGMDIDLVFFAGLLPHIRDLSKVNKRRFHAGVSNLLFSLISEQEQMKAAASMCKDEEDNDDDEEEDQSPERSTDEHYSPVCEDQPPPPQSQVHLNRQQYPTDPNISKQSLQAESHYAEQARHYATQNAGSDPQQAHQERYELPQYCAPPYFTNNT